MSPIVLVVIVLVVLLLFGGGYYGPRYGWGTYHYGGGIGAIVLILIIALVLGYLR